MRCLPLVTLIITIALTPGCAREKVAEKPIDTAAPDYSRPLPEGARALRLVADPARLPDLGQAWRDRDVFLLDAIDRSRRWFEAPSSRDHFPFDDITHEQARASVIAFGHVLATAADETAFIEQVREKFDVYESVGYNGEGVVLFTGYYAPVFPASRTRTSTFNVPLYRRPADLATDPKTGRPLGRRTRDGSVEPYPTRREIEQQRLLAGNELVWVADGLTAYIIHVNGSARLRLTDGSTMFIGYAGKTDRPYKGLGSSMVEAGLLSRAELSLGAIKRVHQRDPHAVERLIHQNESYVFFTEYDGSRWPAGSLGVPVTRETTLATDKAIYPRGGVVMVDTEAVTFGFGTRRFQRFMLDQDTGGAIKAPGRADIFMGIGPSAEILAGGQYAEGRLYYFFLKPGQVAQYATSEEGRLSHAR